MIPRRRFPGSAAEELFSSQACRWPSAVVCFFLLTHQVVQSKVVFIWSPGSKESDRWGAVMWGGRALAPAFALLCALLADHSHTVDACLGPSARRDCTHPVVVRVSSDFNITIGEKPRGAIAGNGGAWRDSGWNAADRAADMVAGAAATALAKPSTCAVEMIGGGSSSGAALAKTAAASAATEANNRQRGICKSRAIAGRSQAAAMSGGTKGGV